MIQEWLHLITGWLEAHPALLPLALFLIACGESLAIVGLLVPGMALLFAFSTLAPASGMSAMHAMAWALAGAVVGDYLSFILGRRLHGRLDQVWPLSRYPRLIADGERFFRRHGGKSVIFGRFVGPVRPVVPLIAGALLMSRSHFLACNVFSAVLWAPVTILPGFLVGIAISQSEKLPSDFYTLAGLLAASLAVLAIVFLLLHRSFGPDSRIYRLTHPHLSRYRYWRSLARQRPAEQPELPLASVVLALSFVWIGVAGQFGSGTELDAYTGRRLADLDLSWLEPLYGYLLVFGNLWLLGFGAFLFIGALLFRGALAAAATVFTGLLLAIAIIALHGSLPLAPHLFGATLLYGMVASFVAADLPVKKRWMSYRTNSKPS